MSAPEMDADGGACGMTAFNSPQYLREFGGAMALYGVSVFVTIVLNVGLGLEGFAAVAMGLIPMIPSLLALRAFLRQFWRLDELQRRIISEAMVIAGAVVGFVSFAAGWTLLALRPEQVIFVFMPMLMVLPVMIAVWGVALKFVTRRYQ